MAQEPGLKDAVRCVVESFQRYARSLAWKKGDYRILYQTKPELGRIHLILVAKEFPDDSPEKNWLSVLDFVESDLKNDPELLDAINVTLRTFEQIEEGGLYTLSPNFVDAEELSAPAGSI